MPLSCAHILEHERENVPQLLVALRCSSFLKYKGVCQHWLFSWSPCHLILDPARHKLRILRMLQQPACSVGDKMSVAECGLGCHMEWLIMGRFCLVSQIKCSTLTAPRHPIPIPLCTSHPTAETCFLCFIVVPSGCSPDPVLRGSDHRQGSERLAHDWVHAASADAHQDGGPGGSMPCAREARAQMACGRLLCESAWGMKGWEAKRKFKSGYTEYI